jgi:hypothetical protein
MVSNDSYSLPSSAAPSNRSSPAPSTISLANTQASSSLSQNSLLADTSRLPVSVQNLLQKAQQLKEREEKERKEHADVSVSFNQSNTTSSNSNPSLSSSSSSSSFLSRGRRSDDIDHNDGDVEDDEDASHAHVDHSARDIETGHQQEPEEGEDKTAKPSRWSWSRDDKKNNQTATTPHRKNDGAGRFAFAFRHRKGEKKGQINLAMLFLCLLLIIFLFGSGLYFSYMKRMAGLNADSTTPVAATPVVANANTPSA